VEGADPLRPYGPNAARHVARTASFPHCPDIVVNSTYWSDSDEVAAFEELVRDVVAVGAVAIEGSRSEALAFLGASLAEASAHAPLLSDALMRMSERSTGDSHLPGAGDDDEADAGQQPPEVVVMASGCLGLISFARAPGRVTLEDIEARYPLLIPVLREHPGIGFLLVRSHQHGALAIGAGGVSYLDEQRVEGEDPLLPFGPHAARHVARTAGFPHCPDIVVNSTYWSDSDEVAAFEELVGSHGGMGGSQSFPFLLHPRELAVPVEEMVGAQRVHRQLRAWLVQLGHAEYREEPGAIPAEAPTGGVARAEDEVPAGDAAGADDKASAS
ncbi:MAG TPA: hypothetical protein VEJ23_07205, partial [Solirubrobacteraceae bacterium]|nr:hypothetical protein [Solirubrobacteraceae bacterium]